MNNLLYMTLLQTAQNQLSEAGLRKTLIREEILLLFLKQGSALSHGEIEGAFLGRFDRVTIYRTLKSFEEKGIIHKVIDDGAVVKYASCHDHCNEHSHHDEHVHFKCLQCQHTFCLHELSVFKPALPPGFSATEYQLLITGTCKQCGR